MGRIFAIAIKDLRLAFRDSGALVMMLLTPFALTLVMGFAFGGFGGGSASTVSGVPVVVANADSGRFGEAFVSALQAEGLADLLEPTVVASAEEARAMVDEGRAAAAVIVPGGLTESVLPVAALAGDYSALVWGQQAAVDVYADPGSPVGAAVVRAVVDQVAGAVSRAVVAPRVAIEQLLANGFVEPAAMTAVGPAIGEAAASAALSQPLVKVVREEVGTGEAASSTEFDWLGYMAPSMAIVFLMFTVTSAGRSVLAERDEGTLARMLVSPASTVQVLGGKVAGIFVTGLAQMAIVILAGWLLLGIDYGPAVAVVLVVVALVTAATAWGTLLAAWARTPAQASWLGSALSLAFAGLAGNFLPRQSLPGWLRTASLFTPNAWGLEAFTSLASGGELADARGAIVALLAMAAVVFGAAALAFRRQYTW